MTQADKNKKLIIKILDKYNIPHWESGKNVVEGSVTIKCCFCSDHSNHLGIVPEGMGFSCFKCHETGKFSYLLTQLLHISKQEANELLGIGTADFKENIESQIKESFLTEEKEKLVHHFKEIDLPPFFELIDENTNCALLDRYLERRQYSRELIISKGCGLCRLGREMNRLVVPVFFGGKLVAYQAVDMTGKAIVKYQADDQSDQIGKVLYQYDEIPEGGWMILVEGLLDAWRVGDNAVCSFGTQLSKEKKELILRKKLSKLTIFFDDDAYWWSKKLSKEFTPFIENVEVIKCPTGYDPDKLSKEQIDELVGR